MNTIVSSVYETESVSPGRSIGSFWRRVFAFFLDGLVVGIAVSLIALPLFNPLSRLGAWGRLIGFALALPYFAVLNSNIGHGQTLGKRWMRLQVVDEGGIPISFRSSVLRYVVLWAPFFLNQILLPTSRIPWIVMFLLVIAIFGLGGATLYLVIFNRRTRQGVHDLAAGSYVVSADSAGPVKVLPTWIGHWLILGVSCLIFFVAGFIFQKRISRFGPFPELLDDLRLIESLKDVQAANIQDLTSSSWKTAEKKKILVVNVFWSGRPGDESVFASRVAKAIFQQDLRAQQHDIVRIVIVRGYDLGIAHAQVTRGYEHSPTEWSNVLVGNSSPE